MQAFEQLLDQRCTFNQISHEHEQRHGDQHIVGHHTVGALHHQIQHLPYRKIRIDAAVEKPRKRHTHAHQRKGRREPEHDRNHHQSQHQQTQAAIGQVGPRRKENNRQHDQPHDDETEPQFFADFHLAAPWPADAATSTSSA